MNTLAKVLIFLGILLALSWMIVVPNTPVSDQILYHHYASSMASSAGYIDHSGNPTAYWAPGYAFFLTPFYWMGGDSYSTAFFANFLIYLSLILGTYYLGTALYSKQKGMWAAALSACYPTFILYTTIIASELIFCALTVWSLYFLWTFLTSSLRSWNRLFFSGLLLGFATLVRPQAIAFIPLVFMFGFVKKTGLRKKMGHLIVLTIIAISVCVPWGIRNYHYFDHFVLVSANFGTNLFIGNHPGATGGYTKLILDKPLPKNRENNIALIELDRNLGKKALTFIKENPGEYLKLMFNRTILAMRSESIGVAWNEKGITKQFGAAALFPLKIIANLFYFTLLITFILTLICLFIKKQMKSQDWFLLTSIIILSLPFIFIQSQMRYHMPLIPYMILFTAGNFPLFPLLPMKRASIIDKYGKDL